MCLTWKRHCSKRVLCRDESHTVLSSPWCLSPTGIQTWRHHWMFYREQHHLFMRMKKKVSLNAALSPSYVSADAEFRGLSLSVWTLAVKNVHRGRTNLCGSRLARLQQVQHHAFCQKNNQYLCVVQAQSRLPAHHFNQFAIFLLSLSYLFLTSGLRHWWLSVPIFLSRCLFSLPALFRLLLLLVSFPFF